MRALPLVVASLALVVSGCGGDPVTPPQPAAPAAPATTAAGFDVCADVSADDVGRALGESVTASEQVLGCGFDSAAQKQPSVSLVQKPLSDYAGGFAEATASSRFVIAGGAGGRLPGIGDAAYLDVGRIPGGRFVGAIGFVQVHDQVVQVNLRQSAGLSPVEVRRLATAVAALVGSAS